MSDAGLLLAAFVSGWVGMACLAVSLDGHWRQLFGARSQTSFVRRLLRVGGAAALLGMLGLCLRADSGAMAVLMFAMLATASAYLTAFAFAILSTGVLRRR